MVRSNIWMRAVCLAALMAGLPVRAGFADPVPSTSPSSTDQDLAIVQGQDASAGSEARDNSARKLVSSHNPALKGALIDIVRNNRGGQLAVARALSSGDWLDNDFIDPLFGLLASRDPSRARAAAAALSQYKTDAVLARLTQIATSRQPDDIRVPVVRAIGTYDSKIAAKTLIDLQQSNDSIAVQQAAGDALMDMTGLDENRHDAQLWKSWWAQHSAQPDPAFTAELLRHRAEVFEREVARRTQLEAAVAKLLTDLYTQAPANQQADIVIQYLHSTAPEIRALGATIVYQARTSNPRGAPPSAMNEVRGMLGDSSAEVRAAVAVALYNDPDSADAMVKQLDVEADDSVRVALIHSLAPLHDARAVTAMIKLVDSQASQEVRIEAAEGIRQQVDLLQKQPELQQQAIAALQSAFSSTGQPGMQSLREALVGTMAAINGKDPRLLSLFQALVSPHGNESVHVRTEALRGLGNMRNAEIGDQIAGYLEDENPEIRLAAVQALGTVPQPDHVEHLLDRMINDRDDAVRAEAWNVLQAWTQRPEFSEYDLAKLADQLKTRDAAKQLVALLALRDRLAKDVANATTDADKQKAAKDLATQQQTIGDLMMSVSQPAAAAGQYTAALAYWRADNGAPDVIDTLCGDEVRALLAAKRWDDAAQFASDTIKLYDNDPAMKFTQETVSREFKLAAEALANSTAADAAKDAESLFAAVAKMNPPLKGSYPDQLARIHQQIQQNAHRGGM